MSRIAVRLLDARGTRPPPWPPRPTPRPSRSRPSAPTRAPGEPSIRMASAIPRPIGEPLAERAGRDVDPRQLRHRRRVSLDRRAEPAQRQEHLVVDMRRSPSGPRRAPARRGPSTARTGRCPRYVGILRRRSADGRRTGPRAGARTTSTTSDGPTRPRSWLGCCRRRSVRRARSRLRAVLHRIPRGRVSFGRGQRTAGCDHRSWPAVPPRRVPAVGSRPMADGSVPSIAPKVAARDAGLRPVLLALAGDSASGKSTLSRGVEFILGRRPGRTRLHRRLPPLRPGDARRAGRDPARPGGQPDGSHGRAPAAARRRHRGVQAHLRPPHGVVRARRDGRCRRDRDRRGPPAAGRPFGARRRSTWRSSWSPTRCSATAGSSSATSSSAATRPKRWSPS